MNNCRFDGDLSMNKIYFANFGSFFDAKFKKIAMVFDISHLQYSSLKLFIG